MSGLPATVVQRLAEAPCLLMMFDYDGTLSPIVERPELATTSEEVMPLLEELSTLPGTEVCVISGRSLADISARVPCPGVTLFGSHGLECLGAVVKPFDEERIRRALEDLSDALRDGLEGIEGARIEEKTLTVAVHYRQVRETDVPRVREVVGRVVDRYSGFRLVEGKKVLELRPDVQADKGTAARGMVEDMTGRCGRPTAFYAGDDLTDEDVFRELRDGVTVLVGPERGTAAAYRVEDPPALVEMLRSLVMMRKKRLGDGCLQ